MVSSFITKGRRLAASSPCKFKHAALICLGRRVLCGATNLDKTHPQGAGPYSTLHAEIRAIRRAQQLQHRKELWPYTIYVFRVGATGEFRPSGPCRDCAKAIRAARLEAEWT